MTSSKKPPNPSQRVSSPAEVASASAVAGAECWCGNSRFVAFGPDYLECHSCGTLVSQKGLSSDELQVVDDEQDFYGKQYWLDHQQEDLDLPSLEARTRSDLPERNLHWLRALLKYKLPPSEVIELGCAHGSFVALMRQAGYAASGVEMSPWVVEFGQNTFGIEVRRGPIETLDIGSGSLDVIAMMDVMEHLPDPVTTMRHCLDLLKPDGVLLVQMPNFEEGMTYEELVTGRSTFLEQLKSDEHLYLYSKRSTIDFFERLGARHIQFEPAIFAHYDMFFVVSRAPLHTNSSNQIEMSLQASPRGRIALALLDMKERYDHAPGLQAELEDSVLLRGELYARADELKNQRNLAEARIADFQCNLDAVEVDRKARGEVIEAQGHSISELQAQVHQRLGELNALFPQLEELRNLSNARLEELSSLQNNFATVEEDRIARGEVIESQGRAISELQAQIHERLAELNGLYQQLDQCAHALQDARREVDERDAHLESVQNAMASHERAAEDSAVEMQRLQDALTERMLEVSDLTDSLVQREQGYQLDVGRREAEMVELGDRWWWKLGKLIKAL